MKVETREDALLHCFDLWLWAAVTGSKHKEDWPGLKKNGGYLEYCLHDCPACEYSESCEHCIIKWKEECCVHAGSEFSKWDNARTKQERTKWALRIAALALDAL